MLVYSCGSRAGGLEEMHLVAMPTCPARADRDYTSCSPPSITWFAILSAFPRAGRLSHEKSDKRQSRSGPQEGTVHI
jgi:hypothetical protein